MTAPRCPYCHGELDGLEKEVACGLCGTPHHGACWNEHGRCVVLGCGSVRAARSRVDARRALTVVVGPARHPFLVRAGPRWGEPRFLSVEAHDVEHRRRGPAAIALAVAPDPARPGDEVVATVTLHLEEPLAIRGLRLQVRSERITPGKLLVHTESLLEREAVIVGHPWEGYLVALKLAAGTLAHALPRRELVTLPAGTNRWTCFFALDGSHPTRGLAREGEWVLTEVCAFVDIPAAPDLMARAPLHVIAR